MSPTDALGPLSPEGTVAPWRQARLGAFLVSAHGALARLAAAQAMLAPGAAGVALNAAAVQAGGLVAGVMRATAWQPDAWVLLHWPRWELAWLPSAPPDVPPGQAMALDAAALGLAIVTVVRPAPLLPADAARDHPFAVALALIEFESGRLLQPFLRQVQAMVPALPRATVEAAVERRRAGVDALWDELVAGLRAP